MRFATPTFLCWCGLLVGGCGQEHPVRIASAAQLEGLVGRRVELVGVVSNTPTPQILRVDLWGAEKLTGQRVRVCGVLQRTIVTRTGIDTARGVDSGKGSFIPPVFRGPGTYYRLQDLSYVSEK